MTDQEGTFTTKEAARFSKLSVVMVNYLCVQKVVEPSGPGERGHGRKRAYTFADLIILRTVKRLLESGISVKHAKAGLRDCKRFYPEISDTRCSRYLVTDGKKVFFRTKQDVFQAFDGSGQFVFAFVIEIRQVRNEVRRAITLGGKR